MKARLKETREMVDVLPMYDDWGNISYWQDINNEDMFYYSEDIEIIDYYGG